MEANTACTKRDKRANCKIKYPGHRDNNNKYCDDSFGVTYKGYLTTQSCYPSIEKAMSAMEGTLSCERRAKVGNYKIIFPGHRDNNNNNKYCDDSFGVTYKGYLAKPNCYNDIDKAISVMDSLSNK